MDIIVKVVQGVDALVPGIDARPIPSITAVACWIVDMAIGRPGGLLGRCIVPLRGIGGLMSIAHRGVRLQLLVMLVTIVAIRCGREGLQVSHDVYAVCSVGGMGRVME